MENKPKTKKECFALLDEMLSEEDKKKMAIIVGCNQQSSATNK